MSDFSINLDFTGVESKEAWKPLEPGDYVFTIDSLVKKDADKNGDPGVTVKFVRGDNRCQAYFGLGSKSLPYFKSFLEKVFGTEIDGAVSFTATDLLNKQVGITVDIESQTAKEPDENGVRKVYTNNVPKAYFHVPV